MDSQDQNGAQTATPPVASAPSSPLPTAHVPTYSPHLIQTDGDIAAVPQEQIGFEAADMVPPPAERLTSPAEVFAEDNPTAASTSPQLPGVESPPAPVAPSQEISQEEDLGEQPLQVPPMVEPSEQPAPPEPGAEVNPVTEQAEKTPLEILEEILASANENPGEGAEPGAATNDPAGEVAKQQAAEEEARQAAARAAEEERYRQEAEQRISLAQQDLQQAAQQREEVTQQLQSQGKQVGPTVSSPTEDQFTIQQLQHDTLSHNNT